MRSTWQILRHPVCEVARKDLRRRWNGLPETLRDKRQIYGRHEEGCGATVGAMPRCDFACRGCYLTANANRTPAQPIPAMKKQLRQLRDDLGPWGNLQLTDGEVTLRPEEELIELLRYAREIELCPMLMTHGDSFRRRPGLLERLMREGGLDEMSLHIDTTQRGRKDYKHVRTEADLNPLRSEFARLVRSARVNTGRPLRVATTITTTMENLSQISDILEGLMAHPDVYRLITFLPAAQVGRTEEGLGGGLDQEAIWQEISSVLGFDTEPWRWHYGHPACNRFTMGLLVEETGHPLHYVPLSMAASAADEHFLGRWFERFGGLATRADRGKRRLARATGIFLAAPGLLTTGAARYGWNLLGRIAPGQSRLRTFLRILTRRIKLHRFTIGTHRFMSAGELDTEEGRERLEHCIFKVPDGDQMVSMCEFNHCGGRERLYASLRQNSR